MSFIQYLPLFFRGTVVTLCAWIISGSMSLFIGTVLGIVSCRSLTTVRLRRIIGWYTFIAKGVPAYVQLLIAYFVIPSLLGITVSAFPAALAALAFCSSGYVTEIVRSSINTISRGQWDACFALGYSVKDTLLRIILPQAFKNAMPTLLGELEQLLKTTSLLATIGISELTRTGMNIISRELNPMPIYLTIACIYLLFSALLHLLTTNIEKGVYDDCR